MLPTASVSLPRRIQSTLLSFSGSSVASGASTRESTSAEMPSPSATVRTSSTKSSAPPTIISSPITTWATIAMVRWVSPAGVEPERPELPHVLALAAVPDRPPRISAVDDQQPGRRRDVDGCRVDQPQADAGGEAGQKDAEVATQGAVVGGHLGAAASPSAECQRAGANQEHGDRAQHEGGTDDGADRDLLGLAAREDRDHGNQRLRQRRTDRGQQASDGSFTEVETIARPLDRVREQDRSADDQRECRRQQELRHAEAAYPPAHRSHEVR